MKFKPEDIKRVIVNRRTVPITHVTNNVMCQDCDRNDGQIVELHMEAGAVLRLLCCTHCDNVVTYDL